MQTYTTKRKNPDRAVPAPQEAAPSRSEMLHLSGAGAPQPMSPQLREKFEPGFGADFSNIRISRGHIPEELGVQAVAQGTDILLDESAGMDVLGHELAHVVQQAQGRVEGGYPVVENAALEHEADVMGARVSSGLTAQAGPQNGFGGGEMMSISPMSSASAPAQCKSRKEKKEEKARAEKEARFAQYGQDVKAYGEKLRGEVTEASEGVTPDTSIKDLISGNRLGYMRSNSGPEGSANYDKVKATLRADTNEVTAAVSQQFADYMQNMPQANDVYDRDDRDIASSLTVSNTLARNPNHAGALAVRAKENAIGREDIGAWLQMMEQDEDAMRMLRMQTDEIYRPLGDFDAQSNKAGIVGGTKHAGIYAMNDMFLRSVSPKGASVNTKRNQISQSVMNRILVGSGDVDHMPQAEREIYDMMMGFLERTGINPAQAPAQAQAAPSSGQLFQQQMAHIQANGSAGGGDQATVPGTPGQLSGPALQWAENNLFTPAPTTSGGPPIGVQTPLPFSLPEAPGVGEADYVDDDDEVDSVSHGIQGSPDDKIEYNMSAEDEGKMLTQALRMFETPEKAENTDAPKKKKHWWQVWK